MGARRESPHHSPTKSTRNTSEQGDSSFAERIAPSLEVAIIVRTVLSLRATFMGLGVGGLSLSRAISTF